MKCDIEVHWHISYFCNFKCVYCLGDKKQKDIFRGLQDSRKIIEGFDRLGLTCQINITGGEPFFYKNFVELCQKLTDKHMICVNTNLSHKNVYRFAETIDPKKVRYLNCSVHIGERERLNLVDDYIKKFNFLKAKGFNAHATYVTYPPFLKRFEQDRAYFKSKGIILRPKLFRGTVKRFPIPLSLLPKKLRRFFLSVYPGDFSKADKKNILAYIQRSQEELSNDGMDHQYDQGELRALNLGVDKLFIDGVPSNKGRLCKTGKTYIRMNPTGEVHRCQGGRHVMGNLFEEGVRLFDKPEKCTFDVCRCPYLGYKYMVKN